METKNGIVGENTLWDRPHSKGSSSGSKGMKLKLADCGCDGLKAPITQRAKG